MDFFADGGFQQLLNDLEDRVEADELDIFGGVMHESALESMRLESGEDKSRESGEAEENCYNYYELLNIESGIDGQTEKFMDISNSRRDYNNNNEEDASSRSGVPWEHYERLHQDDYSPEMKDDFESVCSLRDEIDEFLMFPSVNRHNDDLRDFKALSISRDIAAWEEEFLDNYIELPELSECLLSEKTPLCTDTCEHFLDESHELFTAPFAVENGPASPAEEAAQPLDKGGYPCTFGACVKIYAKPAHLKAHLRRHLGEKPYVCNWPGCSWKFSRSDELSRHRRSHSGVKPYKCSYCMKCFARSDHLTKHRKVHERRMLAASKAGAVLKDGAIPISVLTVRPGRKRKNQY